jgi:hypothetical protein
MTPSSHSLWWSVPSWLWGLQYHHQWCFCWALAQMISQYGLWVMSSLTGFHSCNSLQWRWPNAKQIASVRCRKNTKGLCSSPRRSTCLPKVNTNTHSCRAMTCDPRGISSEDRTWGTGIRSHRQQETAVPKDGVEYSECNGHPAPLPSQIKEKVHVSCTHCRDVQYHYVQTYLQYYLRSNIPNPRRRSRIWRELLVQEEVNKKEEKRLSL